MPQLRLWFLNMTKYKRIADRARDVYYWRSMKGLLDDGKTEISSGYLPGPGGQRRGILVNYENNLMFKYVYPYLGGHGKAKIFINGPWEEEIEKAYNKMLDEQMDRKIDELRTKLGG